MSSFSDSKVYAGDQDCEWRIQLPLGDKIKITFNKFDLEDREICDDFLEVNYNLRGKSSYFTEKERISTFSKNMIIF